MNDANNDVIFVGNINSELSSEINLKVMISGTYKGALVENSINKRLTTTNALSVELISPNSSGVLDELGKIIVAIKYQNGMLYDENTITLNINDENTLFEKINNGKYNGYYGANTSQVGFLKSGLLNLKGADTKGNNVSYSSDIPAMAWMVPMYVYYIFFGLLVLFLIIGVDRKSVV